ncbi:AAA family ATPase [Nocardia puris]|uniref:UvrD-helicase domain-containing protein n=1 Tax=Nocardia puris TaxID=208602 RepID=UPI0018951388|nr:UvrD-helicase domain-containing protein [Nocardia puris]MBF6460137.1 AAA family ATPase [Nocardia puris]
MSTFAPTAEQLHIHDLFRTGKPLRVRAGAGTGKTTTLIQLADILQRENRLGLYLAFNRSIADEAGRKMPSSITASTAHALAYKGIRNTRHADLLPKMRRSRRVPFHETARALGIAGTGIQTADGKGRWLDDRKIARHALATIDRFCKTADDEMTVFHVPPMKGLDGDGDYTNNRALAEHVLPWARKVWADIQNPEGTAVAFGHSHYLKLWALEHPRLGRPGAALFLDEAQDTSPVLAAVIAEQEHLHRVYVGDSAQSIYRFTGAENAMEGFAGSLEGRLTQSWRFGQVVADAANELLAELGDDLRLTGHPGRPSTIDRAHPDYDTILCRTNAGALQQVIDLLESGARVHLMADTGYALAFIDAAAALKEGRPALMEDLAAFTSWGQVVEYAEEATDAADWKTLVDLIERHGIDKLRAALGGVVDERLADVLVVTAHKSKGREWSRVRLADDLAVHLDGARDRLAEAHRSGDPGVTRRARRALADELMLSYVAVTRAQDILNPGRVVSAPDTARSTA